MIWGLAFSVAVLACTTALLYRMFTRQQRSIERERQTFAHEQSKLLDRLMHMAGNTWGPPPIDAHIEEAPDEEDTLWPELEPVE